MDTRPVWERMTTDIGSVLTIDCPSFDVCQWLEKNLIIANPEYTKRVRLNKYLGKTPKYLHLYETDGMTYKLPYGALKPLYPMIKNHPMTLSLATGGSVSYFADIPLYDYQQRAVEALAHERMGILQAPAGSGKTQIGIALTARMGKRCLWLTHTADLLNQSMNRARMYMDEDLIGTITEGKVHVGVGITFATIQTMCRLNLAEYRNRWSMIIVDECHRVAGTPTAMTQFYKVLNCLAAPYKFGLSATVHRADGMIQSTYALLGPVVYEVPSSEVKDKIMKVSVHPIGTECTVTDECLNPDGTLNFVKIVNHLCRDEDRNKLIVDTIQSEGPYPSLILSDRIEHLERLMAMLPEGLRERASLITGKMTSKKGKEERIRALDDLRSGRKKYLFATYRLAKEGLDIPCLERLYLVTPQTDYAIVTQSIGRIARSYPGKGDPVCIDFVDKGSYFARNYTRRRAVYRKAECEFV